MCIRDRITQTGNVRGLHALRALFPGPILLWSAQVGKRWKGDSTGSVRLAQSPEDAQLTDLRVALAMVAQ
eukprot:3541493-Prorocentrum_lima.AAC.1